MKRVGYAILLALLFLIMAFVITLLIRLLELAIGSIAMFILSIWLLIGVGYLIAGDIINGK